MKNDTFLKEILKIYTNREMIKHNFFNHDDLILLILWG